MFSLLGDVFTVWLLVAVLDLLIVGLIMACVGVACCLVLGLFVICLLFRCLLSFVVCLGLFSTGVDCCWRLVVGDGTGSWIWLFLGCFVVGVTFDCFVWFYLFWFACC